MSTLAERLAIAITKADISKAELARRVGIKAPSVNGWFTGKAKFLRGENLLSAALALGVSDQWLATGTGPMLRDEQAAPPPVSSDATAPGYLRFDLFEGAAGMGAGIANSDYPEVIRQVDVADWEIRRKLGFLPAPGRMKLMTGRGPSMRPKIEDGDVVMIDTWCTHFDVDDYYLINVGGDTQIKKLMKRADGMWVVSSNPEFPEWRIEPYDLTICGKALIGLGLRRL